MRKIVKLLVISILISVGLISGCAETNNSSSDEEEKFVGTWEAYSESSISMTFNSDGTFSQVTPFGLIVRNWEVKDEKLVLTGETDSETSSYNYYFSENDTKLHLQTVGTDVYVEYIKK